MTSSRAKPPGQEFPDGAVKAAWTAEAFRRINELDEGQAEPIPWSRAKQLIFGQAPGAATADDPASD